MLYDELATFGTYDSFDIDMDTMELLAEYQRQGRYYLCIPTDYLASSTANDLYLGYTENGTQNANILLAYYSVATFAPYYFVHHNQELRDYFDSIYRRPYSDFTDELPNAAPIINYGASFGSQNISFQKRGLSITDTISSDLTFSKDDILATVYDENGNPLEEQPDISITVDGQTIYIDVAEIESNNLVVVDIPCSCTGAFVSENNDYAETNIGDATAQTTGGTKILLPSPKLYSIPVVLPMTGGVGRACIYRISLILSLLSIVLFGRNLTNIKQKT